MSTIEQQATGTFVADPVHSHVGFEVPYAVATFSGEVTDFTATPRRRAPRGLGEDREHQAEGREPPGAPALARVLRRRAPSRVSPSAATSSATATARRSRARSRSRASRSRPRSRARSSARPSTTTARRASASSSRRSIDRTAFGMNWNMPLPNGEPALANEVTLKADLTLVAQEA